MNLYAADPDGMTDCFAGIGVRIEIDRDVVVVDDHRLNGEVAGGVDADVVIFVERFVDKFEL